MKGRLFNGIFLAGVIYLMKGLKKGLMSLTILVTRVLPLKADPKPKVWALQQVVVNKSIN